MLKLRALALSLIFCFLFFAGFADAHEKSVMLVLDPGHGGKDHGGAHGDGFYYKGRYLPEDAYTYDVATRIEALAIKRGWKIFFTVVPLGDSEKHAVKNEAYIASHKDMIYNIIGADTIVFSGKDGLIPRLNAVEQGVNKDEYDAVIFISIHFDNADPHYHGATIYTTPEQAEDPFIKILSKKFIDHNLGFHHLDKPIKNIDTRPEFIVLTDGTIRPRILVELGNFNHPRDRALMLSGPSRQKYAEVMVEAIEEFISVNGYESHQ